MQYRTPANPSADLKMMRDSFSWPMRNQRLPLKRRLAQDGSFPELGYLEVGLGPKVILGNVLGGPTVLVHDNHICYDTHAAIAADGWVVD